MIWGSLIKIPLRPLGRERYTRGATQFRLTCFLTKNPPVRNDGDKASLTL
jgi:hypothetical protein